MSDLPDTSLPQKTEGATPRFDRPHHSKTTGRGLARYDRTDDDPVPEMASETVRAAAGASTVFADEQLQQQAAELAGHLRGRQRELSRHKETLNARVAQWEDEQRSSRLWLREQQAELQQRESELQQWHNGLEKTAAELKAAQQTAEIQAVLGTELDRREKQVRLDDERLTRDSEIAKQRIAQLDQDRLDWQQQRDEQEQTLCGQKAAFETGQRAARDLSAKLQRQLESYEQDVVTFRKQASGQRDKLCQLKSLESMLRRRSSELDQERISLSRERDDFRLQTRTQRQSLATHWRRRRLQFQTELANLQKQRDALTQREQVLDTASERLRQRDREAIEKRLVAEHLRRELEGKAAPTQWQSAADDLHEWLDSQLSQANSEMAWQEEALHALAQRLAEQQQKLESRRVELIEAITDRHKQTEQRAQLLDKRASELTERTQRLDDARRQWNRYWHEQQMKLQL